MIDFMVVLIESRMKYEKKRIREPIHTAANTCTPEGSFSERGSVTNRESDEWLIVRRFGFHLRRF